jgi:hypothetical protein
MHLVGFNCNSCITKRGIKNVKNVLSVKFCPMHQYSKHAAGVWPDCRLETNLFCWARQSGVVAKQHDSRIGFSGAIDMINKVVDFYYLVWSQ